MEIKIDIGGWTNFHSFYRVSEPGLIIILLDQTQLEYDEVNNLCDLPSIAKEVNKFIYNLILSNVYYDKIKDRCFLKLISYADEQFEIKEGWLTTFADKPISIEKNEPIWIEDKHIGQKPTQIAFIENHFKEWHMGKGSEYPESIIVHFYKGGNNEIAKSIKSFVGSKLSFKRPVYIENIIK